MISFFHFFILTMFPFSTLVSYSVHLLKASNVARFFCYCLHSCTYLLLQYLLVDFFFHFLAHLHRLLRSLLQSLQYYSFLTACILIIFQTYSFSFLILFHFRAHISASLHFFILTVFPISVLALYFGSLP